MTSVIYSVSASQLYTTPYANGTPHPLQGEVYGRLYSNQVATDWPETATSIVFTGLVSITSISVTVLPLYPTTGGTATGNATFGKVVSEGNKEPWPLSAQGIVVSGISPDSTTTTSTTSALSMSTGTTTAGARNTASSTSNPPSSSSSSSPQTPSTSLQSSSSSSSHASGISTGAIAGTAIGCALAGLVIGLFAAFCLFRRKGKRSSSEENEVLGHDVALYTSDKGTPVHDLPLSQFLLEATPDRDIAQETQSIGALIEQHVESYYHDHPVSLDTGALASALSHLGFQSTTSAAFLGAHEAATLCLDPQSRQVGLRHVLMRVLFSSIDIHCSHGLSMLPAPIASFLRAIPPAASDRFGDPQANALALRKWRELSVFLLHPARSQRTSLPTGDAEVAARAQEVANSLNSFLHFFVDQQQQQQQGYHLQAVIEECAKLGCMLLSHPSDWEFVYEAGSTVQGVVVEPGLCKMGGDAGSPSPSVQRLVEPVVVSSQVSR